MVEIRGVSVVKKTCGVLQHTHASQTTVIAVTNQAREGVLAGIRPTPWMDMPQFISSRMDMLFACLRISNVLID